MSQSSFPVFLDCAPSTGGSFNPLTLWIANFSDAFGWSSRPYYSTIRFPQ
jgi:hypothetical protein